MHPRKPVTPGHLMMALLLASCSLLVSGADPRRRAAPGGFLRKSAAESELVVALQEAAGGIHGKDTMSLKEIAVILHPAFLALPRDHKGHISATAVRYLVHTFFMKTHGWLIRGLEPLRAAQGTEMASAADNAVMGIKDKVPYIIETVLKTQETQGFELSHAVMMVSLLEHLILDEGLVLLE